MTRLADLSNDEKVMLETLLSMDGMTKLTIGGQGFEQCLSHRAAIALLSLMGRGLVSYELFNDTGRMEYSASDAGRSILGKISRAFIEQHGNFQIGVPVENVALSD